MYIYLLLATLVMIACVLFNKISNKLGIPVLLAFIILGMLFGCDGIFKISFDNFAFAEQICSVALIFIMFYGGFGTKWSEAKPVAVKAVLLSSLGTVLTALSLGLFCHFVLKIALLESFLIGAVICSTDAASVFSILRSKKLGLKYNTASLLEVESGSNDPFSYMLTVIVLAMMNGNVSAGRFIYMIFAQIVYGALGGVVISVLALAFIKKFKFPAPGFDAVFIVAVAVAAYAVPGVLGGNGYLSVYITGIILGNNRIPGKQALVNFFDGTTGLMQMLLFFLLGLLSSPSQMPFIIPTAFFISLFLTFIARPIAVFLVLTPFRSNIKQQLLVAWAGMRGAASIVFAIIAVIDTAVTDNDIFHIVFFIVLFSILFQGSLIPFVAKKLGLTDKDADVMKTFTDYTDEVPVQFLQFTITENHKWADKTVREIPLPPDSLLVLILRGDEKIVPNGSTLVKTGDRLILSGRATDRIDGIRLYEKEIHRGDDWESKTISQINSENNLIIMIRRKNNVVIPRGNTKLISGDILVINDVE